VDVNAVSTKHFSYSARSQSKFPSADRAQVGQRSRRPAWDSIVNSSSDIANSHIHGTSS